MFWDFITKVGADGASALLKATGSFAKDIRTAITGTAPFTDQQRADIIAQANALEQAAMNMDAQVMQGQIEINKIEAASSSLFKSGWRPALGWACVSGFVYQFLINPIAPWVLNVCKVVTPPLPNLDSGTLMSLTLGMLGLAGARTFEKIMGTKANVDNPYKDSNGAKK